MSAICMAWDWNIPPNINTGQSNAMQIDNPEPQTPDMQIGNIVSLEDDRLTIKLQIKKDQILQRKREVKINNKAK